MELKQELQDQKAENVTGFVVNALTTANQRASSKSSTGSSINSFIQKKLTCAAKAGLDIAHPNTNSLAINVQNSTGTNFSSGATASGDGNSVSSGILNNVLKSNKFIGQLQGEMGVHYGQQPQASKLPNTQIMNSSVGMAIHKDNCQVAPPKVISCTKPNKQA